MFRKAASVKAASVSAIVMAMAIAESAASAMMALACISVLCSIAFSLFARRPHAAGQLMLCYAFALVLFRAVGAAAGSAGGINSMPSPLPFRQWMGVVIFPPRPVGASIPSRRKAAMASLPSVNSQDDSSIEARAKARECAAIRLPSESNRKLALILPVQGRISGDVKPIRKPML